MYSITLPSLFRIINSCMKFISSIKVNFADDLKSILAEKKICRLEPSHGKYSLVRFYVISDLLATKNYS